MVEWLYSIVFSSPFFGESFGETEILLNFASGEVYGDEFNGVKLNWFLLDFLLLFSFDFDLMSSCACSSSEIIINNSLNSSFKNSLYCSRVASVRAMFGVLELTEFESNWITSLIGSELTAVNWKNLFSWIVANNSCCAESNRSPFFLFAFKV